MATIFDIKQETKTATTTVAAAEHNAQIKERYQRLQSVERSQFAEISSQSRASVLAPERPVETQSPVQHVEERVVSPLFSTETLDRTLQNQSPVVEFAPVAQETAVVATQNVQLSKFAKLFLGACAGTIAGLLCMICACTQLINVTQIKIDAKAARNAQLRQEYSQLSADLERATSYETIEEYALSKGMVKIDR